MDRERNSIEWPDAGALLAAADHRQTSSGHAGDLTSCLLLEVQTALSADYVNLWEVTNSDGPRIFRTQGVDARVPTRAVQASVGIVKQLGLPAGTQGVWGTSSVVCDGVQLVLEMQIAGDCPNPELLLELSDIFADLYRRKLIESLRKKSSRDADLERVVSLLHTDLDSIRVANCLASDAVELLNCSRISVGRRKASGRWDLVAATAVSEPELRSDASRKLCRVLEAAANQKTTNQPEEGESVQTQSGMHTWIQPLTVAGNWTDAEWAAVFEWTDRRQDAGEPWLLQTLCRHAAQSLQNCSHHSNSAVLSVFRRLPFQLRARRIIVLTLILVVAVGAMFFGQLQLRVEVMGKLVPADRMYVFAPEDGVITDVFVEDGATVDAGAPLCRLRNEDLEIQYEMIDGELSAAQARLAALESLRGDRSLSQSGLLSAEQAELTVRRQSLEKQLAILNVRISGLTVPASVAGQVYGDRLRELLQGRPVRRGQYLFELANPDGDWQLDFRVPEADVRYVVDALAKTPAGVPVAYAVETAPDTVLKSSLSGLSSSTDIDEFGHLSSLASVESGAGDIPQPRPGAGVIGWIECGTRPAGYVLFRRLIEAWERKWWM